METVRDTTRVTIRKHWFRRNGFAITIATIHLLVVLAACRFCMRTTDPDWPMVWAVFLLIDGPIIFLSSAFPHYSRMTYFPGGESAPLNDPNNFWIPALICGILGTVQWFFVAKLLAMMFAKPRAQTDSPIVPLDKHSLPTDI